MSDNQNFGGFGKFIPGFDFLQNLAKGASQSLPQMPNLSNWIAPTLNLEDLEKRIGELKAVHFWLDQNSKALGATIQALEVQKMTLATLKGMNFNMGEVANALQLKPAEGMFGGAQKPAEAPAEKAKPPQPAAKAKAPRKTEKAADQAATGVVDPLQWWSALTQQFQQIATDAMKDAAAHAAADPGRNLGGAAAANEPTASAATAKGATGATGASSGKAAKSPAARAKRPARKTEES